jgi:DNA-directed RNA polymerase subunit RPC12/RpoP
MSTHNRLNALVKCSRCGCFVEAEIECYFGFSNLNSYKIGDKYDWRPRKSVKNGGRPEDGNIEGEGYAECPSCGKDFFVKVIVRDDIIQSIQPDLSKKSYMPD